jgi:hypothetical protein
MAITWPTTSRTATDTWPECRYYELAGLRLPHRLRLAGNTLATSQVLATLKGFYQDFLPICPYVVFASSCLFLQEAPHRGSDHRQSSATHIEQRVSKSRGTPRWVTRAGPTATHWHSPLKCWVSLGWIADARKQQVLRLGACPPLFNRTRPGNFPAGRRKRWISHAPRESRTIHASFSQNCWLEARALPGGRINCSRN